MLNLLFGIGTWGLVLLLLPWCAWMAIVAGAAWGNRATKGQKPTSAPARSRFLFLIPAHNEAEVIGITVASCLGVEYDRNRFQVFVIADNCSDETASIAERAGALVMVRTDATRKSKGYALEDFFATAATNLAIQPHDAFVLVDADTSVAPDLLNQFDRALERGDDFVQGYYTVRNADISWRTRLMTFAFSLTNGVWLAGLDGLGLGVGLKGNGMCFRAAALERFPWRAYGLVEDMEYAWNLRLAGERVRFLSQALVYGEMVSRGGAGAASQRRRWETGRKALRAKFRQQLWKARPLGFGQKIAYSIELDFPPLSRLAIALVAASLLVVSARLTGHFSSVVLNASLVLGLEWAMLLAYVLSPFLIMSLPLHYLVTLAYVPYYILWKLTLRREQSPEQWVRTPREASSQIPAQ